MSQFLEWLSRLFNSWKFWVVVAPWEIGVRVRLGKKAISLGPGPHIRIPFLDEITLVNTRLRIATAPSVTVRAANNNGKTRVITAVVGYSVRDPLAAVLRYTTPETAVLLQFGNLCLGGRDADACLLALTASLSESGIVPEFVRYVEDVDVRTYRLLQGIGSLWGGEAPQPTPGTHARY
jgi:hypothetical protein